MPQPPGSRGAPFPTQTHRASPLTPCRDHVHAQPSSPQLAHCPLAPPRAAGPGAGQGLGEVRARELPRSGAGVPGLAGSAWVCAGRAVYPVWQRV